MRVLLEEQRTKHAKDNSICTSRNRRPVRKEKELRHGPNPHLYLLLLRCRLGAFGLLVCLLEGLLEALRSHLFTMSPCI